MLGIIGAMDSEVAALKEQMENLEIKQIAGMDFYQGTLEGKTVVVVKCGIGKVNAAVCAQILIDCFGVEGFINTGVAGSLNQEIDICDVVISKTTQEHDMDVRPLGYDPGIIPDMESSVFMADARLVELAKNSAKKAGIDVKVFEGKIVSGDQFIATSEKKDFLKNVFAGDCAEMEGAAIGHVAMINKIPYVAIRSISDKADGSAHMDYPTFEKKAAKNSIMLILQMMRDYE